MAETDRPTPQAALLDRAEDIARRSLADPAGTGAAAEALALEARAAGDVEATVVGLRASAWSARATLDPHRAQSLLDEAARLCRRAGLSARLGEVLITRAAVHQELGQLRAANRDLDRARLLWGGRSPPAELDHARAVVYQNAGRLPEAESLYRRVLRGRAAAPIVSVKAANNLALIEIRHGRYAVALALLESARQLADAVGPGITAYVAESQAWVTALAGRLPESLQLFAQAEELLLQAHLPLGELHAERADALADLWLLPEAASAAARAVTEFTAANALLMAAEAELCAAKVALRAGRYVEADLAAARATASLRGQRRAGWSARAVVLGVEARYRDGRVTAIDLSRVRRAAATLDRLGMRVEAVEGHLTSGQVAAALGRTSEATQGLDRARALARRGPLLTRLLGSLAAATAADVRNDPTATLRHCHQGLVTLDRHRSSLASSELRVLSSAHGAALGTLAVATAARSASPTRVFAWMERTRAAALVSVQPATVADPAEEFRVLRRTRAELGQEGSESLALAARHDALEQRLRRLSWGAADTLAATQVARVPVGQVRRALEERVMVEYGVVEGSILAVVVDQSGFRVHQLGPLAAIADELAPLAFSLRALADMRRRSAQPAHVAAVRARLKRLRSRLVNPLTVDPGRELVIVPTDLLQRVPWSALHMAPVVVCPSAATWVVTRARRPSVSGVLLAAGPGLAAAHDEVRRLALLYPDPVTLAPAESLVAAVTGGLEVADLAHFACHGTIRVDNPLFSALLLADGHLTVHELELRGLAPRRVVLAACDLASDAILPGGEMLGFISALMARGTAAVLASLHPVPDDATPRFMSEFHRRLGGGDTFAVALHAARELLDRDEPADLVNWCGFTAFGAG